MKHAFAVPLIIVAAGLIAAANYKPSVPPLPPHPSSKAISNVGMTPDYSDSSASAGKATPEIADMMPAATAPSQDALNPEAVVSYNSSAGDGPGLVAEKVGDNHGSGRARVSPQGRSSEEAGSGSQAPPAVSVVEQMLAASNAMRYAAGRYGQSLDERLCAAAQQHATHLAATGYPYGRNDSGHYWGNGTCLTRAQRQGFAVGSVREVIAPGYLGFTIPGAFAAWRGSPSHYASVVSAETSCGFGYAENRQTGWCVYVGLFGTESPAVARSETGAGSSYPKPSRTLPTAVYSVCGPGGCGPAMQGQSYQWQRRRLFGR